MHGLALFGFASCCSLVGAVPDFGSRGYRSLHGAGGHVLERLAAGSLLLQVRLKEGSRDCRV